jgi:hypothetical protein
MNLNLKNLLRRARARLLTSSRKRSIAAKAGWDLRRKRADRIAFARKQFDILEERMYLEQALECGLVAALQQPTAPEQSLDAAINSTKELITKRPQRGRKG